MTPVALHAEAPEMIHTSSFARRTQRMQDCESKFLRLLSKLGEATALYRELQQASQAQDHVQQMLANFAPATLKRDLSCRESFVAFHLADGSCSSQVSPAILADYLCIAKLAQARARHASHLPDHRHQSAAMVVKSMHVVRAAGRHAEQHRPHIPQSTTIKDVRESIPIPMALSAAWERAVCDRKSFTQSVRLFLGTALLCTRGSVRFGDIQRTAWSSLQLSTQGLHGTCAATKTTRRRQPFAVTWHGISGRDAQSSWLLHWLAESV